MFMQMTSEQRLKAAAENSKKNQKNTCYPRRTELSADLPNFARACGRVSVGGHPDKRPDSRPKARFAFEKSNRQPEAKPAHLALKRGT